MQSKAKTVKAYLDELPEDRRAALEAVRAVLLKNLDRDYEEGMLYGGICYYVPHRIYPPGYHCDPKLPLTFAGIASQKNHMAVYLSCLYYDEAQDKRFRSAWKKTGKKLDMGKSCIRFRKIEDLALDLIGEAIARIPVKKYIAHYEATLGGHRKPRVSVKKSKTTRPATKKRTSQRS